ncbi:MAG: PAS domain S-box protein [Pseudomonadota bacterium]
MGYDLINGDDERSETSIKSKGKHQQKMRELRLRAEKIVQSSANLKTMTSEEIRRIIHELQVHQIELEMQNEELLRVQDELAASQEHYFDFYNLAPLGYCTLSEKGLILETNLTTAMMLGENREALIRQRISTYILAEDQDSFYLLRKQLLDTGTPCELELRMVKKNGTIFWINLKATTNRDDVGTPVCRIVLNDITKRKFKEDLGELSTLLIAPITTPEDLLQRMSSLTASLQKWSGCEAVGIRLQNGDDYPYYETRGFPAAFVQAESRLCSYGPDREILRDSEDKSVLECMCGNILRGRFDPAKPFFSAKGSFWTNGTTALLAGTTEADRQTPTRNRCNREGYESVALVPFRANDQIIGLLQFNDHRPNRFSSALIAHFERLADLLTIALSRRQTEILLRESEERFRNIIEHSKAGYFFIDLAGRFKTVNTAWLHMHKYNSPEEILDHHFSKVQIDTNQARAEEIVNQTLTGAIITQGEFKRLCKDGSIGWHTFSANPVYKDGKVIGLEGFIIDITKPKRIEEALHASEQQRLQEHMAANAQLSAQADELELRVEQRTLELQETQKQFLHVEKLSAIGKLSASIAHEFNNPLQGILSILKGLKKRAILEEEDRELLEAAISESNRMKSLIHSLQDFNRPTSGRKSLVDIHATLNSLLLLHKSDLKGKRIRVELDCAERLPQILAVPDQITQVFLNLLSNATDACAKEGGMITVRTRQEGDRVAIAVGDNGVGIQPENIDRIFQPFYTTKFEVKGTGLGLSVSYGIVQRHKGEIFVESHPGEGSTFTVRLPVSEPDPPETDWGGTTEGQVYGAHSTIKKMTEISYSNKSAS